MALKYRIYKTSAVVSSGNIQRIDDAAPTVILQGFSLETAVSINYNNSGFINIYYFGTNTPVIQGVLYSDIWDDTDTPMASLNDAIVYLDTVFTQPSGGGGGGDATAANQTAQITLATDGTQKARAFTEQYDTFVPVEGVATGQAQLRTDVGGNLQARALALTDESSYRTDFNGVALDAGWTQDLGVAGSLVFGSSLAVLKAGIGTDTAILTYPVDYCPLTLRGALKIEQRDATKSFIFGLTYRNGGVIEQGAYFLFDGTDATSVKCVTQSSSAASDFEVKTINFNGTASTNGQQFYKVDVSNNTVSFSVSANGDNYYVVAQNILHIPNPYQELNIEISQENTASPDVKGIRVDMVFVNNMNRVQVDDDFSYEPSPVAINGVTSYGAYKIASITPEGHLEVALHEPILPFGSVHVESITPIFQSDAVYGLDTNQQITNVSGTGTATAADALFVVSTGATVGSTAVIQSRKRLRYRAGQGSIARFTGWFTSPVADSYQLIGLGHSEDGVYFGYQGEEFGILYVNRGVREVQTLTITTASSTAENVTVTLDGVPNSIAVTNSANIQRTVWELSQGTYAGWTCVPVGATLVFLANSAGNKAGAFTVAGTTIAGTFAETKAGVDSTDLFVPQSQWNGDKFDGTGASGVTADWTKGNVFQIGIQYLGAGSITFKVEENSTDANNPTWITAHTLKLPNTLDTSSFRNPSFPFTMAVYSAGSTTDLSVKCASYMGGIEGGKYLIGNRFSYNGFKTTVNDATYVPFFTVINRNVYGGISNQSVVNLISVSGAVKSTNPVVYYLVKNAALVGNPNFASFASNSTTLIDTTATGVTFTNEQIVWTGALGETGEFDHHFNGSGFEEFTLQPGEWVTLCAKTVAGNAAYATGSINTREDK